MAIVKHCEPGDLECRRRQRQAVLYWAYDSRTLSRCYRTIVLARVTIVADVPAIARKYPTKRFGSGAS